MDTLEPAALSGHASGLEQMFGAEFAVSESSLREIGSFCPIILLKHLQTRLAGDANTSPRPSLRSGSLRRSTSQAYSLSGYSFTGVCMVQPLRYPQSVLLTHRR